MIRRIQPLAIMGRQVGPGHRCLVIAEAGVNHNGRVDAAKQLIDAAAEAHADIIKFQTFGAERLASPVAPKAAYQRQAAGEGESQLEMLRRLELSAGEFGALQAHCRVRGIGFLSTPFDEESADVLEALGVAAFKIGSGEVTNLPLLEHVARKRKPLLLSTGMSTLQEVDQAVRVIRRAGNDQIVLLHCVSNYPANPAEVNLRAMHTMAAALHLPVGYSDHTLGIEVALAAAALGACVIEKHLTLDRSLPGPDHAASIEPDAFARLVSGIRAVESALGDGRKQPSPREAEVARAARKSLVAARHIRAGTPLTEELVAIKRPGTGLPPGLRGQVIGRKAKIDIPGGAVLTWDMVAAEEARHRLKRRGAHACRSS